MCVQTILEAMIFSCTYGRWLVQILDTHHKAAPSGTRTRPFIHSRLVGGARIRARVNIGECTCMHTALPSSSNLSPIYSTLSLICATK